MDARASERIAEEQAALRRVATLVAGGAPPEEVFAAVTRTSTSRAGSRARWRSPPTTWSARR